MAAGRRVHLTYYVPGRDEATERDVDPMRLVLVDGRTYLEGWCRRAEGVRLFRIDRVVAIEVLRQGCPTSAPFQYAAAHGTVEDYRALVELPRVEQRLFREGALSSMRHRLGLAEDGNPRQGK